MKTMISIYIFSIQLLINFPLYTMENAMIQCFTIAPPITNTYPKRSSDQLQKYEKKEKHKSRDSLNLPKEQVIENLLQQRAIEIQNLNEICVPIWSYNSITSKKNLSNTISVNGLGSCLAAAIHIRYNNGEQYAGITNYPRLSYQDQQDKLKNLCEIAFNAQHTTKQIITTNFIFMIPNKNTDPQPPTIQYYSLEYEELKNIIEKALKKTITRSYCYLYKRGHTNRHKTGDQIWRNLEIILYNNKATMIVHAEKSVINTI